MIAIRKRRIQNMTIKELRKRYEYLKSKLGKRGETNQMRYIKYQLRRKAA